MSYTPGNVSLIVSTGENPRTHLICSMPKRGCLMIKTQTNDGVELQLQTDGLRLPILLLFTAIEALLPVWYSASLKAPDSTSPSTSAGSTPEDRS
jgi:hypothetical protein